MVGNLLKKGVKQIYLYRFGRNPDHYIYLGKPAEEGRLDPCHAGGHPSRNSHLTLYYRVMQSNGNSLCGYFVENHPHPIPPPDPDPFHDPPPDPDPFLDPLPYPLPRHNERHAKAAVQSLIELRN